MVQQLYLMKAHEFAFKCFTGKESTCQSRRQGFDPWVGNILWRVKWQTTPVFLPGKSHGRRSLVGCKELNVTEWLRMSTHGSAGQRRLCSRLSLARASYLGNFAPDVSYLPLWNSWPAWTVLTVMSEEREINQKHAGTFKPLLQARLLTSC